MDAEVTELLEMPVLRECSVRTSVIDNQPRLAVQKEF
jgi:hypothetical protein